MNTPEHSYFGTVKNIAVLRPEEKASAARWLALFMEKHPVRAPVSVFAFLRSFRLHPVLAYVLIVAFLSATSGITIVSAEYADPGDVLYPIKVGVTEEVIRVVASYYSPVSEAAWNVERIERRAEEVVHLAQDGVIDEEDIAWALERTGSRMRDVQEISVTLIENGEQDLAEQAMEDLEVSLNVAADFLASFTDEASPASPVRTHMLLLAAELRRKAHEAVQERELLEADVADAAAYPDATQEKTEHAEEILKHVRDDLLDADTIPPTLLDDVQDVVAIVEETLRSSRAATRMEQHERAFSEANEAGRHAKKARELLEFQGNVEK